MGPLLPFLILSVAGCSATQEGGALGSSWPVAPPLELERAEVGELPPTVTAEPAPGSGWIVTFALPSSLDAERVHLAGSFNDWSSTDRPFARDADGRWRTQVKLAEGVHSYKFVLDGTSWIPDPENEDGEPDGFQSVNSLLRLGALGHPDQLAAEPRDGQVFTAALEHDPERSLYRQRAAAGGALLRYRTLIDDVECVSLVVRGGEAHEMRVVAHNGPFAFWEARVPLADEALEYGFLLREGELLATDPRTFRCSLDDLPDFRTPDWTKHAVWYQIMVDRFRNGDASNDPDPVRPWTAEWYTPSKWEGADGQTFYEFFVFRRMYGGDLAGVRSKLDYLVELGVNAIYFNPVFQAPGHHKYNATDFRHIDTGYGAGENYWDATKDEDLLDPSTWVWTPSDRAFLDLLKECKARGIRVVLDGVFNHVGVRHPAFADVIENGKDSRFADWFEVRSWEPFQYAGWAGFGELPVFAKDERGLASDAVKEHIFAITRRWMDPDGDGDPSDGIDGWRLDVPMEIAMPFWEEWRDLVKSINPDAYITGEVWDSAEAWLDGKRFDAVMNYRFADAAVAWIGHVDNKISASEVDARLANVRLAYPAEATSSLMDLLDSHDTDRFVSMMLNPDRGFDRGNREQEPGNDYDPRRPDEVHYRKLRLAALLQMTYVGAPMIYYGDEVGMWGSDDPNNRKPMLWKDLEPYDEPDVNRVDEEHLAYYREVVRLRRSHEALRVGSFETVLTDDVQDLWVFRRALDGEELLVAMTPSESGASFELPAPSGGGRWELAFGPESVDGDGGSAVGVPAVGGRVWRAVR